MNRSDTHAAIRAHQARTRCAHGMREGQCVVSSCVHYDGKGRVDAAPVEALEPHPRELPAQPIRLVEPSPRRPTPAQAERRQCEALNYTHRAGVLRQCKSYGEQREGTDRWLCWVCNQARLNPYRTEPLQYIEKESK